MSVGEEESSRGEVEGRAAARAVRNALAAIAAAARDNDADGPSVVPRASVAAAAAPAAVRSLQCIIWCDIIARLGRSRHRRLREKNMT